MSSLVLMLKTLLSVKQHREKRIRSAITQLASRQNELAQRYEEIRIKRDMFCKQWRDFTAGERTLTPAEWQKFRAKMAHYYQQDHCFLEQADSLQRQYAMLEEEKEHQEGLLRKILLNQEKLKFLVQNHV